MQLNTAQNCVKRVRPTKESNNSVTVQPRLTTFCQIIRANPFYSHAGYDVTSYFQFAFIEVRKTAKNAVSDALGSNLGGATFCLTHQLVGFFLANSL